MKKRERLCGGDWRLFRKEKRRGNEREYLGFLGASYLERTRRGGGNPSLRSFPYRWSQ